MKQHLHLARLVVDLCLPATGGGANRLKRALLFSVFNGDWASITVVEHMLKGCCQGFDDCVERVAPSSVVVFAASASKAWPRSRWLGPKETTKWLLLIQSCRGLLSPTCLLWAGKLRGGAWVPLPPDGDPQLGDQAGSEANDAADNKAAGVAALLPEHDSTSQRRWR